jgi:hypothetical protein
MAEAKRQVGETLCLCKVDVDHWDRDCQNCDILLIPRVYCKESRFHPDHSLHLCSPVQYCSCVDA